jgi:hypothetical protein
MIDQYRPHVIPPNWVYGPDFWKVVYDNINQFFWNSLTLGPTKKHSISFPRGKMVW